MKKLLMGLVPIAAVAAVTVASAPQGPKLDPGIDRIASLGGPIDGLTDEELAAFERGREVFERRFKPSDGLGPFYNATSCVSCHSTPVTGGGSDLYRNFYVAMAGTSHTNQGPLPPFLSPVIPSYGSGDFHLGSVFTLEGPRASLPTTYNGIPVISAQRNGIPIFGVGLFEFISNNTIISHQDPIDLNGDGISGRRNRQIGTTGRFGVKSQVNNIESFVRGPLQNQMGITTDPFLGFGAIVTASAAAAQAGSDFDPTFDADGVPDPEMSAQDLGDLIAFTTFLAPVEPLPFSRAARRGEELFAGMRCGKCHIPSMPSSRGPVNAYTDLLIHYMGNDLADNLQFGDTSTNTTREFRTAPLWGVSLFGPWLHDGRASTLKQAIELHAGEAVFSRNAFNALSEDEQADVIEFLEHL